LVLVSSIAPKYLQSNGPHKRRQKSSGSVGLCADCIARICDGGPLPAALSSGIAEVCKAMNIELQRSLPLATKTLKKVKKSK
jgi:hypothetical protein